MRKNKDKVPKVYMYSIVQLCNDLMYTMPHYLMLESLACGIATT